jgi:transcription elongation factor
VQVPKYYLDRRPLNHALQLQLPAQQHFEPPPDSIQIGDSIEVIAGEHRGKCGIVDWFPMGGTDIWFRDASTNDDDKSGGPLTIQVPATVVRRTNLRKTLEFTKERGYDVKPGDVVSVARGPEFGAEGVVQMVDLPNAHLTLLSGDQLLVCIIHSAYQSISDL